MTKIAFIYPGQGSQYIGMGQDFYNNSKIARDIFSKFNSILGKDLTKLCFEGPEEDLKQTINTQPAILAISIIAYELLKEKLNIKPSYLAGHSLGEYAALYSANVLNLDDVIKLVQKRAKLMQESQSGAMSAILGLSDEKLTKILEDSEQYGTITVANYNTPDQTVITGEAAAIESANKLAAEYGAKRVVPLPVSGAFHSPLMKEVSEKFTESLSNITVNDALIPVITNVDSKETSNSNEFIAKMAEQIYSSVHWKQTISYMIEQGVDVFIEIGPGKVLSGMIKKINRSAKTYNISDTETLHATASKLSSTLSCI